jgi:hypothetical protein
MKKIQIIAAFIICIILFAIPWFYGLRKLAMLAIGE